MNGEQTGAGNAAKYGDFIIVGEGEGQAARPCRAAHISGVTHCISTRAGRRHDATPALGALTVLLV
jgi:hypothetical protein